ncbi:MAG: type III pantothenate kinase [Bacteroidota bacterium]
MNLVIDAGNTSVKFAVFDRDGKILLKRTEQHANTSALFSVIKQYSIDYCIISDVGGILTQDLKKSLQHLDLLEMGAFTPVPVKIHYKSQETLGTDRIAAAVYGYKHFPGIPVLVIQAGTCITYEYISEEGVYHGGAISPGIDLRLKSLNTFTAYLPLIKKQQIDYLTGTTTEESILSGVINGCIAETDGMIEQYSKKYGSVKTIIGGGDAFFFDKKLKNRIFAVENLVLQGLNHILNYNNAQY